MKANLIVARSGEKSLHEHWQSNGVPNFDLAVTFYGQKVPSEWNIDSYVKFETIPGGKWKGLFQFLTNETLWKGYDRIFLPDDDLLFDAATINDFFSISAELSADLSQPALDEESYFSHQITVVQRDFIYRETNFVEIMCPCFSNRFLTVALQFFNEMESGWGMDYLWPRLLEEQSMRRPIIVDQSPIRHTRPVSSSGHAEQDALMAKYNIEKADHSSIAGMLKNKEMIHGNLPPRNPVQSPQLR